MLAGSRPQSADVVFGVSAQATPDNERFLGRMATKFPFLHPAQLMDANRRKTDHPDYDPR